MPTVFPMQASLYERAAQVLNHEILSLEYAEKRIKDKADWPKFDTWRIAAESELSTIDALLRSIRYDFSGKPADENWGKLLAYVDYVSALDETITNTGDSRPEVGSLAHEGYSLATRLFRSEEVVQTVENLANYKSTPPPVVPLISERHVTHMSQRTFIHNPVSSTHRFKCFTWRKQHRPGIASTTSTHRCE